MERAETQANYDYHFVRVADIGDATEMPDGALEAAFRPNSGLIATWPGGAVVLTGSQSGVMTMMLEAWETTPPVPTSEWEEVLENIYESPTGTVYVLDVWGSRRPRSTELLTLTSGPGVYHVRAHAQGRASARSLFGGADHAETMLLQFWPIVASETPGH